MTNGTINCENGGSSIGLLVSVTEVEWISLHTLDASKNELWGPLLLPLKANKVKIDIMISIHQGHYMT